MVKKLHKFIPFAFIVILGLIPLFDLFREGLPLTHDGQDHLARIANFYSALTDGVVVPRWGANLNWGFGHPVLMFLYPFPSYLASLFHFLGFSLTESLKIVFGGTFLLSGIGAFFWIRKLLGVNAAVFGAILYMFAPYRFVNLYVRGAIGEHVAFAFIPFILFFITRIFLDKNKEVKTLALNSLGIAISTALLILSHNALSILFLSFAGAYTLTLFFYNRNLRKLIFIGLGTLYGFSLSMFFWFPALIEGKYTLRNIVTGGGEYAQRFVESPLRFFATDWSYGITGELSVQIGVVHIALIIISLFAFYKISKKENLKKAIYLLTLIFFLVSLFMMLKESNFVWSLLTTLQKFQFPWRFLSLTVLASALLGSYAVLIIKKKEKILISFILLILLIIFFYGSYWKAKDFLVKDDSFFKTIYHGTTDTGESAPRWSVRFMEEEPNAPVEIISGSGVIQQLNRTSIRHEYQVDAKERIRIKENTLYFPGWSIYVDGEKLDVNTDLQFQDPGYRGVMTFYLPPGDHNVEVVFEETRIRMMANVISAASVALLLILIAGLILKR